MRCSLGAAEGHLYPLNKSFIFINKPAVYCPYDQVASVEFARVQQVRACVRA